MNAIKNNGLSGYIINLMVMDYGSTTATNCVVENGKCNMGKSGCDQLA
jgi:chitinase